MSSASSAQILRKSLSRWRIATALTTLVLLVAVAGAGYIIIDRAISFTYLSSELENAYEQVRTLESLILQVSPSTTRNELLDAVRRIDQHAFEKGPVIHAGGIGFYFTSSNELACITASYPAEGSRCAPYVPPGE